MPIQIRFAKESEFSRSQEVHGIC